MAIDKLLSPLRLGTLTLPNRVVMAPLTRSRAAQPGDVPTALNAEYYAQRAGAGLIVTEAAQISRQGQGYALTPGIYSGAQIDGWRRVTDAVHRQGGHIALQLWHVGRISHASLQPGGGQPVAPSAIRANMQTFIIQADGTPAHPPCDEPRALRGEELPGIVADYAQGARNAIAAGFDLVEIHAANGYLLHQFLATATNRRDDAYGGSLENRARLVLEVVDAVVAAVGAERVGIRLSPWMPYNDIEDAEAGPMALYLAEQLGRRGLAYLHLHEAEWMGVPGYPEGFREAVRARFPGAIVVCGGYTAARAEALLQTGLADAVAFGRPYIANPDLVQRFAQGAPLAEADQATFYGGGTEGYTDYPAWAG
ncbi:alkene reductase [Azotobacter chroococcum]|nr:alkene reductase [Azotobacter chroococcum]TBW09853.1 alkene reductase [Azotobacter chroococcum]TKD32670.1 alkene reductase [Azotobacter chroococcum]